MEEEGTEPFGSFWPFEGGNRLVMKESDGGTVVPDAPAPVSAFATESGNGAMLGIEKSVSEDEVSTRFGAFVDASDFFLGPPWVDGSNEPFALLFCLVSSGS